MRRILAVLLFASFLMFGGGLLLLGVPGQAVKAIIEPTAPSTTPEPSDSSSAPACGASGISWLALTSKHKETAYAFGNPVGARSRSDVLNAIRAYAYKDPAGAAALTAAFDGTYDAVNDRVANYVDDHGLWCQEVNRMMDTATSAAFSTHTVKAGAWSLYMVKATDSGNVKVAIRQGETTKSGTAAVFTFNGRTVELRLDCHFQPVASSRFPKVPHVPSTRTPSPTVTTKPTHEATPKPSQSLTPKDAGTSNGQWKQWGDTGKGADVGNGSKPKSSATSAPSATTKPVQTSTGSTLTSGSSGSPSSSTPSAPKEGGSGTAGGTPSVF